MREGLLTLRMARDPNNTNSEDNRKLSATDERMPKQKKLQSISQPDYDGAKNEIRKTTS